ncbi:hypothetical protein DFH27DRAFT_624690 [Peziza echinospora]|nr:hypothetical protein DFH27DRAFT_624690 [Peziza echinospora]
MQFTATFITLLSVTFATLASAGTVTPSVLTELARRQFDSGTNNDKAVLGNDGNNNGQSNFNKGTVKGDYTVNQAISSCGNAQLNCCNSVEQADQDAGGLVGVIATVAGPLGVGCSPIAAILAPVKKMCSKETVCCMGPSMPTQFGLININCSPINLGILG